MIVTRYAFDRVLKELGECKQLALDSEATGLRPYHGSRLFSLILARSPEQGFYFNFQQYYDALHEPLLDESMVLSPEHLQRMQELFDQPKMLWFLANAKYDMAILAGDSLSLRGDIHCTVAQGRVEHSEYLKYDLDTSLERIGLEKDDAPKKWILENDAWEWVSIPGRAKREKNLHFDRVPFDIIVPYGLKDACGTYALGIHQVESIRRQSAESDGEMRTVSTVSANERRLTKTVFDMERVGALVDRDFCLRAAQFEAARAHLAGEKFKELTGHDYRQSGKLFQEVFDSERDIWEWNEPTQTGQKNPCFDSDALAKFQNPAAKEVLTLRDAKSKSDFYTGFTYHADEFGRVHPQFNPHGAAHGRFSSSNPNFQNLKKDEGDALLAEFVVRRAIIPTPGFLLCSIDYSVMEYRFMLEYACEEAGRLIPLAKRIVGGEDYHQAIADLASQTAGFTVTRTQAKTSNFLDLYGGGNQKLADQLGISLEQAQKIRDAIRLGAPELKVLSKGIINAVKRGYIRNWFGRRCYISDADYGYKAPNYLIAGGCADIVKLAMNEISDLLQHKKSRMILTIHDEIVFELSQDELDLIPELKRIMEQAYPSKWVPFTCSVEVGEKSLADLEEWHETRDKISPESSGPILTDPERNVLGCYPAEG